MLEITRLPINLTPNREHKIISHYGTYNFYRHFKQKYPNSRINEVLYRKILREVNSKLRDKIGTGPYDLKLPRLFGVIKVRKYYPEFSILPDGTCKNKMAINFKDTLRLWEEYPETRERRQKIYYENEHSDGFMFKIKYDKIVAKYKNKSVYMFRPNRELKDLLGSNIINKTIDAFLSN